MASRNNKIYIGVRIPRGMDKQIKQTASQQKTTPSDIIRKATAIGLKQLKT